MARPLGVGRLSIITRVLAVSAASLLVLAGALLLVVKSTIDETLLDQKKIEVTSVTNLERTLLDQNGKPAIIDGKLVFGSWVANGDYSIVDAIKEKTGAEATIFQLVGGKLVRVSTTVKNADGSRAVGTALTGPAAGALAQGADQFTGVNPILGVDHVTKYEAIRDERGQVIGLVFAGVPLTIITQAERHVEAEVAQTGLAVLLLGLGALFLVTRPVKRGIHQITAVARQIAETDLPSLAGVASALAEGDLTRRVQTTALPVEVAGQGELSLLAANFNRMIDSLTTVGRDFTEMSADLQDRVGGIRTNADRVAEASSQLLATARETGLATGQIASTVQQVAAGNHEQARSTDEVVQLMGQLRQAISQIARGAEEQSRDVETTSSAAGQMARLLDGVAASIREVADSAGRTEGSAKQGREAVGKVVDGVEALRGSVRASAAKVEELGKRSEQIGAIVEAIDEIADQTNLLALNAAIEAARAGEHGRGFAVVADEVRKLAERASRSTREIAQLIESVQKETSDAVSAMETGVREAEVGASLAAEAGRSFQAILGDVESVGTQARQIASVVREVSRASSELVSGMESVSAVVEENTAATEQMAASAEQVGRALESVGAVSEESAASVEEVSASAEEVATQVQEVAASAQGLAAMADELRATVVVFRVDRSPG